jgi:hypothetical protein
MANQKSFKDFQVVQPGLKYIYTTRQTLDYVKTQALLGMKEINIEGVSEQNWEVLLSVEELGIAECKAEYDYQNHKQIIRLKLK